MKDSDTYKALISQLVKQKAYRDASFTAGSLAETIGVKDYALSRIMKKEFGKSFTAMFNALRVKDAMRYLKDRRLTGTTVDDIGYMVGFGNRQTFYSEFRKHTGLAPAQYRKAEADSRQRKGTVSRRQNHKQKGSPDNKNTPSKNEK